MQKKYVEDHLMLGDELLQKDGLWAKTEVIAGYGYHPGKDRFSLSYLDEQIFDPQTNMVPISGVKMLFQMLFGVKDEYFIEGSFYDRYGIGLPNEENLPNFLVPETEKLNGPATSRTALYDIGDFVQLVALGITGTAENNITVHKVGYRETDLNVPVKTKDGMVDCIMLPWRFTESELDPNDRMKYFGKKIDPDLGKTAYYYKRYASWPEIKHIWRSSDEISHKVSEITANTATIKDTNRDDALKSLVEIHFTVDVDDLKEWFNYKLDQPESARFNTIALLGGKYSEKNKPDSEQFGDYCNVFLFSKLNIPTEPVSLEKDLEFIYRVYGS